MYTRLTKLANNFDPGWKRHGPVLVDVTVEKIYGTGAKVALCKVSGQAMLI